MLSGDRTETELGRKEYGLAEIFAPRTIGAVCGKLDRQKPCLPGSSDRRPWQTTTSFCCPPSTEPPRSIPEGERDLLLSTQWLTGERPLADSQETRGISAEGVMVIHGVQTVTGGGETRTPGDWKTS